MKHCALWFGVRRQASFQGWGGEAKRRHHRGWWRKVANHRAASSTKSPHWGGVNAAAGHGCHSELWLAAAFLITAEAATIQQCDTQQCQAARRQCIRPCHLTSYWLKGNIVGASYSISSEGAKVARHHGQFPGPRWAPERPGRGPRLGNKSTWWAL